MPRYVSRPGHPKASKWGFVDVNDLGPEPELAANAPILAGRFYENTAATDGTDIGSRRKHRDYMKAKGWTTSSDYGPAYYEKLRADRNREFARERRVHVEQGLYQLETQKGRK